MGNRFWRSFHNLSFRLPDDQHFAKGLSHILGEVGATHFGSALHLKFGTHPFSKPRNSRVKQPWNQAEGVVMPVTSLLKSKAEVVAR
jgi:hypothetical protein